MKEEFGCLFLVVGVIVIMFVGMCLRTLENDQLQQELDAAPVTVKIYNAHTFYHKSDSCAYCKYLKDKPK